MSSNVARRSPGTSRNCLADRPCECWVSPVRTRVVHGVDVVARERLGGAGGGAFGLGWERRGSGARAGGGRRRGGGLRQRGRLGVRRTAGEQGHRADAGDDGSQQLPGHRTAERGGTTRRRHHSTPKKIVPRRCSENSDASESTQSGAIRTAPTLPGDNPPARGRALARTGDIGRPANGASARPVVAPGREQPGQRGVSSLIIQWSAWRTTIIRNRWSPPGNSWGFASLSA